METGKAYEELHAAVVMIIKTNWSILKTNNNYNAEEQRYADSLVCNAVLQSIKKIEWPSENAFAMIHLAVHSVFWLFVTENFTRLVFFIML